MQYIIQYAEDSVFDEEKPVKLTTFKKLEESIIEEQDVGCEKESSFKQDVEVIETIPEKHETEALSSNEKGFDVILLTSDNQEKQSDTITKIKPDVLPRTKK